MTESTPQKIQVEQIESFGAAVCFLLFPIFFVSAQLLHPNLFQINTINNATDWINHFRGQHLLHLAHLLEFVCAPLLIIMALHFKNRLHGQMTKATLIGTVMVFTGALMLLANKSALCLTISGFDTLSDHEMESIRPGLEVLLNKEGLLMVLNLLLILPIGWVIFGIVLIRTKQISRWQSIPLTIGSLLLANPEIEVINFVASLFLAAGLLPYSIILFKQMKQERDMI
jgi:hypothetical protein